MRKVRRAAAINQKWVPKFRSSNDQPTDWRRPLLRRRPNRWMETFSVLAWRQSIWPRPNKNRRPETKKKPILCCIKIGFYCQYWQSQFFFFASPSTARKVPHVRSWTNLVGDQDSVVFKIWRRGQYIVQRRIFCGLRRVFGKQRVPGSSIGIIPIFNYNYPLGYKL